MDISVKFKALQDDLLSMGKVVIAFSGGVDSTFLVKAAAETLGVENVIACTIVSSVFAKRQLAQAIELTASFGVELKQIEASGLENADFAANKADKCFHCKSFYYRLIKQFAQGRGFEHVVCGANLDDADDYRPGNRAAKVMEVGSPLMDAGLTKQDIRQLSRDRDLPTAEMPASPCLASRIAYGLEITPERLGQVEQAEDFIRGLGPSEFRVRHHGNLARIEVGPGYIDKLTAEDVRGQIVEKFKSLGFKFVTIDLQGFRSGALNEELTDEQKRENL